MKKFIFMKRFVFAFILLVVLTGRAWSAESNLPSHYDLRDHGIVPSMIRNQGKWGLCWAFAALASVESNYMLGVSEDPNFAVPELNDSTADNPHASELYLGWFTHKAPTGEEHLAFSVTSGDTTLLSMKYLEEHPELVINGANWNVPTALMARGFGYGPIPHSELPYPETPNEAALIPLLNKKPGNYTSVLWLTDVEIMEYPKAGSANFVSDREAVIRTVKNQIIKNGAVALVYMDVDNSRNSVYKTYYCSEADEEAVKKKNPKAAGGHVVAVIGWDDTVPPESFDVSERERPTIPGAWLVRNSWGDDNVTHDHGYFWMSYEQHSEFQSYIVNPAGKNMTCYDWDPLGWCTEWGEKGKDSYAVNVFKTGSQDVKLNRISFYTTYDETPVELYVRSDYGTTKPTKDTVGLGRAIVTDYTYDYAGYHSYTLSEDQVITIPANSYFSVAMKIGSNFEKPVAVETRVKGYSDYAEVFDGESFFSTDGRTWTDGTKMTLTDSETGKVDAAPMNACIKAFVSSVSGETVEPQPETPKDEQTIDGRFWNTRPDNTVNDADLMNANNPSGENAAILTGRELSLFLLDNDSNPLAEGTQVTLKFLFAGTGASYDMYYDPDYDDEDDDGHTYGYVERPGDEWIRQFYPVGYEPREYIDDEGELYAAYVTTVNVSGSNGNVILNANDIPTDTAGHTIPVGYYDTFYVVSDASGDVVGTLPVINITAASDNNNSGSSGGCEAVSSFSVLGLAVLFGVLRRRTR